jgi:hypothetical protein
MGKGGARRATRQAGTANKKDDEDGVGAADMVGNHVAQMRMQEDLEEDDNFNNPLAGRPGSGGATFSPFYKLCFWHNKRSQ